MKHLPRSFLKTVIQSLHAEGAAKNRLAAPKTIAKSTSLTCIEMGSNRFFALPTGQSGSLRSAYLYERQALNDGSFWIP